MRSVATLLAFAASALAISVTSPNNSTGWSTSGNNTVSWDAVSSDPSNFTILLVNMNEFPNYSQVLDALVDTSLGSISVGPPSGGWVSGEGYQVNLVHSATELSTILAQSNDFVVTQSTSSSSSGASSGAPSTFSIPPTASSAPSGSTPTSSGALNPSSSDSSTSPSSTNGASPAMGMQAALFAAVAFLGVTLA